MKSIKLIIMVLIVTFIFAAAQRADAAPTVEQIFDKMKNMNPGLNDFSAKIDITVSAKYSIISPTLDFNGDYFFKKPDRHKLKLNKASALVNKYPHIFGWNLPKTEKFNSTITGVKSVDGKACYVIKMVPKQGMGDIINEELWVNVSDYTFLKQIYNYQGGGYIEVDIKYRKESGYSLFDSMKAYFSFPKISLKANVSAKYGAYKLNPGLSDDIFR